MDWFRLRHTIGLCLQLTGTKRASYIKKHNLFYHIGDNCMFMFRKLPLYSELISCGDNVRLASNVTLITHDVTHTMLNYRENTGKYNEYIGCIEIGNNVFVGANTTILYNSRIPSDTIIGTNSLVNRKLKSGGVYAGSPVKYVCSIEDFLEKRKDYRLIVQKENNRLSRQTIDEAWQSFACMEISR